MAYGSIKGVLDNVAFVWIGPVVFVLLGPQMKFDAAQLIDLIPESLALTAALMVAQSLPLWLWISHTYKTTSSPTRRFIR